MVFFTQVQGPILQSWLNLSWICLSYLDEQSQTLAPLNKQHYKAGYHLD